MSLFRLPGGTERVINTKSTTVVDDIVEDLCKVKFPKVMMMAIVRMTFSGHWSDSGRGEG